MMQTFQSDTTDTHPTPPQGLNTLAVSSIYMCICGDESVSSVSSVGLIQGNTKLTRKKGKLINLVTPSDTTDTLLDHARFWNQLEVAVIPISYRDKKPDSRLLPDGDWGCFKTRLPSDTELLKWFAGGFHNYGVVVGWRNLVVVDFDDLQAYMRWSLWIARRKTINRTVQAALKVSTSRGIHVYFTTVTPAQNAKLPGIDIKAQGGYVLGAGSIHPSGRSYSVIEGRFPAAIQALSDVLPAEMIAAHTEYADVVHATGLPMVAVPDDPWTRAERAFNPGEDLIVQIKQRYSIDQFLTLDVHKSPRWYVTRCPFHDDKNPSFWVDVQRGLCGCFAGCTPKAYDVIDLYARLNNLTVRDAINILARGV